MGRLTDNDRHLGPITYARSSWSPWRLVYSSGGEDEKFNSITAYAFGWVARLKLPNILQPWRRKIVAQSWDAATVARMGRNWYYDEHPREYGFSLHEGFLQLFLGAQTHDSETTQSWSTHLPWTQLRHVRFTLYDLEGYEFWTQREDEKRAQGFASFDAQREATALAPKAVFEFDDHDGKRIKATTHIEEREWRLGTGWFRWLSVFAKPKISRSLSIEFSEEVGPEKGSWKGGTLGTGITMLAHEDAEAAFRRYCEEEHRSKYQSYHITYVGRVTPT